ncbi:hypothetical protein SUDANB15_02152 [Streptomyces sp. enrichment culture]
MRAAVAEARRRGARRITLRVLGHNTAARALYASEGFVVEGVRPEEFHLDGAYVDDVLTGPSLPRAASPPGAYEVTGSPVSTGAVASAARSASPATSSAVST